MSSGSTIRVESLDQEGRGVAHADGKVIFIEGALPGELVTYSSYRKKPSFEIARAVTQVCAPYMPILQKYGVDPIQHIGSLLNSHTTLMFGAPEFVNTMRRSDPDASRSK